MKTAESYWFEYSQKGNLTGSIFITEANFKKAIRESQKEALIEAARVAKLNEFFDQRDCETRYSVDQQSILKLIQDLK